MSKGYYSPEACQERRRTEYWLDRLRPGDFIRQDDGNVWYRVKLIGKTSVFLDDNTWVPLRNVTEARLKPPREGRS